MTRVEITCSVCGKREAQTVLYLAGEGEKFPDPETFPERPPLCFACSEEQLKELIGPEMWARREGEIALIEAFYASLPPDTPPEEAQRLYAEYRQRRVESGEEDWRG